MVEALVDWAEFIHEHGVEAALARADTAIAEREAARDRAALLREQGDDVNASEQRVDLIHKHLEG
jgi:(E)-4-hydroxy-3-methylbut-2-enyl-diphosphate synthase